MALEIVPLVGDLLLFPGDLILLGGDFLLFDADAVLHLGDLALEDADLALEHRDFFFQIRLEGLGSSFLLTLCYVLTSSSGLLVLALLPGLKLLLHSSFVECALLYATFEVLHQVNALALEDVASCVGGLCANLYPVECTLEIQIYSCRIGVRIVSTNLLSKSTITWCSCVSDNDAVESIAFTTAAL